VVASYTAVLVGAIAAGALTDAVACYRGPFLDGFHLPDAPEFERRVEELRARLDAAYVAALERLAADAERRGDTASVVQWRRTLAGLDRLDARRAMALMRALAAAGDSAGALAHARAYELIVSAELDAPADPALLTLADEIRSSAATRGPPPTAEPPDEPAHSERATADTTIRAEPIAAGRADDAPDPEPPAVRHRRARLVLVATLVLLAATASFGVSRMTSRRSASAAPAAASPPSIAVLPLKNLGTSPGDVSLADGMTEALVTALSGTGRVRVVPSTWVAALQRRHLDFPQIAETLHVSHVLDGGVQKDGNRLRMRVRLLDARDGSTRWSETYDREMGDVFALQDDIARSVADELGARLATAGAARVVAPRHTPKIDAYEWYLRGMDLSLMRTGAGIERGIAYFDSAIAADSNFAGAYAGLARMYMSLAGTTPGNEHEAYARAEWAARRAVALDDSSAEGYGALGWARMNSRDWAGAEAALQRAIALDPHTPRAYEGLARVHLWTGRHPEQLADARRGVEVDPYSASAVRELALALAMNGRCDEALERLRPLKTLSPPARVAGVIAGQCYAAKGMWPEAIAEFRWAGETEDAVTALSFLGFALARGGHEAEARRILADLLAGRRHSHGAFGIAAVYAGLRKYDEAFAWLHKAVDEGSERAYLMGPMLDDLRRDPRFVDVKRQLRL
jgi:TolB-like protein/DNA-binding SARP family transcriptional activator